MDVDESTATDLIDQAGRCRADGRVVPSAWSVLRKKIDHLLKSTRGTAEIRLCEELDEDSLATAQVGIHEVVHLMGGDVEAALDEQRFSELAAKLPKGTISV